jgi:hypothetical protein
MNVCPPFPHLFFDLYENGYEVSAHNAVEQLGILWKSSQLRLYFSYVRAKGITFTSIYTLKVKNAFVMTVCSVAECVCTLSGFVPKVVYTERSVNLRVG